MQVSFPDDSNSLIPPTEASVLTRIGTYQNTLNNLFLRVFSPKQLIRSDSMLECCQNVIPYLKQSLVQQCWKVLFITKSLVFPAKKDEFLSTSLLALQAIHEFESSLANGNVGQFKITPENAKNIRVFLSQPLSDSDFDKLNAYLRFTGQSSLWRTLKACKELFLPLQEEYAENIQTKMLSIQKSLNEPLDAPFNPDHKLTPQDFRFLKVARSRRELLTMLNANEIKCYSAEKLYSKWELLEKLNNSEVMNNIRNRCEKGYKAGQIFFYDWHFIEIMDFYPLDLMWAAKHILYGRIPHLGIIIMSEENKPQLSHVNGAMGTHGIHPIRFPLIGALGNLGELDISPLIPAEVRSGDKEKLKKCFSEAFVKFASEEHPEVKLEWKPTCFLGHKGLFAHDLSEVDFKPEESQFCSSYVGVIFLKAVNEVNKKLSTLEYGERIKHPFGTHEITNRVDTLRLLYHFKQLKVIKEVPLDDFVNKVFAAPKL